MSDFFTKRYEENDVDISKKELIAALTPINYNKDVKVNSGAHEDVTENKLLDIGLIKLEITLTKSQKERILKGNKNIQDIVPRGYFISQPLGSQHHPDFIISINEMIFLECKSVKDKRISVLNNTMIDPNCLYMITTSKGTKFANGYDNNCEIGVKCGNEFTEALRAFADICQQPESNKEMKVLLAKHVIELGRKFKEVSPLHYLYMRQQYQLKDELIFIGEY